MGARTGQPRGFMRDPVARAARAKKAGLASGRARLRKAKESAAGLTPGEALIKGYGMGYRQAYHLWRAWARQTVEQLTGRKVA